MPNTLTCQECGYAPVSWSANKCPRCGSVFFNGVLCRVCKEAMRASESVIPVTKLFNGRVCGLHQGCLATLFTAPPSMPCRDCGAPISIPAARDLAMMKGGAGIECRRCGGINNLGYQNYPYSGGVCSHCYLVMLSAIHQTRETRYTIGLTVPYHYHAHCYEICFKAEHPHANDVADERRAKRSFWTRLFG